MTVHMLSYAPRTGNLVTGIPHRDHSQIEISTLGSTGVHSSFISHFITQLKVQTITRGLIDFHPPPLIWKLH